MAQTLTFRKLTARPVLLKLQRPVTARIATIPDWPLILIDIETEEGRPGARLSGTLCAEGNEVPGPGPA